MSKIVRPVVAEIDLGVFATNVEIILRIISPARLCVVVKADGHGHGAVRVGGTASAAGATSLAVALVEEGVELRDAGIDTPILVLSEPTPAEITSRSPPTSRSPCTRPAAWRR